MTQRVKEQERKPRVGYRMLGTDRGQLINCGDSKGPGQQSPTPGTILSQLKAIWLHVTPCFAIRTPYNLLLVPISSLSSSSTFLPLISSDCSNFLYSSSRQPPFHHLAISTHNFHIIESVQLSFKAKFSPSYHTET